MRYTHSFYALSIIIVMVVTFVFIWHATEYPPMFSTGLYSPSILVKPTPVNIATVLTAELPHQKGLAFTKDDDNLNGFAVLGSPASYIELDDSKIIDIKTGEPVRDFNEGTTFNLAVLKLPHGSKWGFLGVARGPTRRREFMRLSGYESREQVLVAMGLNMTSYGELVTVTPAQTLDLPMAPKEGCLWTGEWVATYGAEDPRLFWTDAGTPALTYGRNSDHPDLCRGIGFVRDVRSLFPDLEDAIHPVQGVLPFMRRGPPGQGNDHELRRTNNQRGLEKNWMAFYPGFQPSPHSVYPHIHYTLVPDLSLEPVSVQLRKVLYENTQPTFPEASSCVHDNHPAWGGDTFHQATPLYRLTLCDRGCVADKHNTVFVALNHIVSHIQSRPTYAKFVATYNVSSPYNLISVGPQFSINGQDDVHETTYVLTLTPIEASDKDTSLQPVVLPVTYLPDHFFLDDDMLISMGHADSTMVSSVVSVREVIGRQRMCQ